MPKTFHSSHEFVIKIYLRLFLYCLIIGSCLNLSDMKTGRDWSLFYIIFELLFLGFTTTTRPPRSVDINVGGFLSGRNLVRNHQQQEQQEDVDEEEEEIEEAQVENRFKGTFPKFGVDGRRPKVKANIRAKLAHSGGKKKFFQKFDKPLRKSGRKVNLDFKRKNKIEFVEPQFKPAAAPLARTEHPSESEFSGINTDGN